MNKEEIEAKIEKLKSTAYDCVMNIEFHTNKRNQINKQIIELTQELKQHGSNVSN